MSHHKLRKEKNCLNCGTTVEDRFCPHCGQENTVNRPSFHYLFTHFFEDLFHYDSGFWKTMKTLLFRPGVIIKEYLLGKRKSFVPPVKLYIFISFAAFFIPFILPDFDGDSDNVTEFKHGLQEGLKSDFEGIEVAGFQNIKTVQQLDSIQNILPEDKKVPDLEYRIFRQTLETIENNTDSETAEIDTIENESDGLQVNLDDKKNFRVFSENGLSIGKYKNIKTAEQLDSIDNSFPKKERLDWASKKLFKKLLEFRQRQVEEGENLSGEFIEAFVHNLPKVLFVYLPIFAFFLWLFHSKKKWFYYDHGIFTLYYFSFLLILITLNVLVAWIFSSFSLLIPSLDNIFTLIWVLFSCFSFGYSFFYFFRAHSRVYEEKKYISRFKSFILFWVNSFFILLTLMIYTFFTFMTI